MDDAPGRGTSNLALAVGAVAAGSAVCLGTYFAIGGPFGTLNDIGTGTAGVLSAVLAWRLRSVLPSRIARPALAAALVGAGVTVAGSALVISGTTGFFLAGLVSSVGFAGIGAWLMALGAAQASRETWPRSLRALALAAGGTMALGVTLLPAIAQGLDDMGSAPAWVWLGEIGWLGIFVLYPAWALLFGARLRGGERRATPVAISGAP